MEYYKLNPCIAKRTRAQEDRFLVQLCNKLKKERGELPISKNRPDPDHHPAEIISTLPCKSYNRSGPMVDAAANLRSNSEESSKEGNGAVSGEKVDCEFSELVYDADSDESVLSDSEEEDPDDTDYVTEKPDFSASEGSSSSEEGLNYVSAKAKKMTCKASRYLSIDFNGNEGKQSDSITSRNKQLGCNAKMKSKIQVGCRVADDAALDKRTSCKFRKHDAALDKRTSCKFRKHESFVGSDDTIASGDRSTDDLGGSAFLLKSNFFLDANKSNPLDREDAGKDDHLESKTYAHFVEPKICKSYRNSKTYLDTQSDGVTLGGHGNESSHHGKVGKVVTVDIPFTVSQQAQPRQHAVGNPPKVCEEDGETRKPHSKRRRGDHDIFRILADSTLGEEVLEDEDCGERPNQSCSVANTLSYKFSFEDDDPAPVEKLEYEIEVEKLFNEMEFSLRCEEMGSYESSMVENENVNALVAEKRRYVLCLEGKHQLVLDDQIGLRCLYCFYVEREIQFVMPEWAKSTTRVSERERFCNDNGISILDGFQFKASGDDSEKSSNYAKGSIWDIIPGTRENMFPHQREGFEFL